MPDSGLTTPKEEDKRKRIDQIIELLEDQKIRDGRKIMRRPAGQAMDAPLIPYIIAEDLKRKEEERQRERSKYEKPDPDLTRMRHQLRGPYFTQDLPELTGEAKKRAEEKEEIEAGDVSTEPYEGQSAWESFLDMGITATRAVKKTAGLDYLFELIAPEEEAELYASEFRKGTGGVAGLKAGLQAQKFLPHPVLKAAAPVIGTIGGAIIGKAAGGETLTPGEYFEMGTYGAGYGTMLTQVKNLGVAGRMILGGAEAGTIGYVARQGRSLIDEGKVLPLSDQWKALALEVGLGAAIGPFIKMKPGNEIHARYTAKNKEVSDLFSNRIDLLRRQLKKPYGSKFKTPQAREDGHKLLKTLNDDIKLIESMPEVLFDLGKNPELTGRLIFLIKQQRGARLRRGKGVKVDGDEAFIDSINFLNALGSERYLAELLKLRPKKADASQTKESYEGGIPMFWPKDVSIADKIAETWRFFDASDMPKGKLGTLMSAVTFGNLKRVYHGTADVFERWARESGAGENHFGDKMANALHNAVSSGDNYSGQILELALSKANKLDYNTWRTRKETEIANQEYSDYMRLRHSREGGVLGDSIDTVTGQPRDVSEGMVRKGVPGDMGTKEGGHVPLRPGEDPSVTSGEVGENMRIARSREAYNNSSPMGKALIEGWNDASSVIGAKMKDLEIVVVGAGGTARLANVKEGYFPTRLHEDFERALKNIKKKNADGSLKYDKELTVLRKEWGVATNEELRHKYKDYLKSQEVGNPYGSDTGELFSHLERAKTSKDYPAELRDWGPDVGTLYLDLAARRIAEVEQFGQMYKAGGKATGDRVGSVKSNPDYIFNRGYENMDESTRAFIDLTHSAVFGVQKSRGLKYINRGLTIGMIGNQFSALKNLTGMFKTWTVVENKSMAKALGLQVVDQLDQIAQKVRGSKAERPNTALARIIGTTRNDIGQLSQMIDDAQVGITKRPFDITGGVLKVFGFTPAENFVRRQATQAFEFERAAFLQKYDDNPEAERLVKAIWDLHHNPKSKELQDAVESFIGPGLSLSKRPERVLKNRALAVHARFLTKMGINMNKMAEERFAHVMGHRTEVPLTPKTAPETMRFIQRAVHEVQGGYKYNQLPVFMQEQHYRIFTKFMSWSMQMQRHFERNVLSEAREGNLRPLAKYIAGGQIAGESLGHVASWFGRDRDDASWAEIKAVMKEADAWETFKMLAIRGANNLMLGGQWDLFGDMVGGKALRMHKTGKLDKVGVPALDWWQLMNDALERRFHQGGDNAQLAKDLGRLASGVHRTTQLLTESGALGERKKEWQEFESLERQMKGFARTWESTDYVRGGLGKGRSATPGEFVLPKYHGFKRDLRRALIFGEVEEAKRLAEEHIWDKIDDEEWIKGAYDKLWKELTPSVRAAQPLKMGRRYSKENQESMIKFMERRNWPGREELLAHQDRYIRTAVAAGLLPPEEEPSIIETESEKAKRVNDLVKVFTDVWYEKREGKMDPQMIVKAANKAFGWEQYANMVRHTEPIPTDVKAHDPDDPDKVRPRPDFEIGGKRGWPYSKQDWQKTRLGQDYSDKALSIVMGRIHEKIRNKKLSGLWLEPEFMGIPSDIGRANYIQKRWDELGINEASRKKYMDDLQKLGLSGYIQWLREEKRQREEKKKQKKLDE